MNFSEFLNEANVSDKDADILNSITIGELQSKYSGKPELDALINLLIKDKYKNLGKGVKAGTISFDANPEELKAKSAAKAYFIDELLKGPKIFTHLIEPGKTWQSPSKFRHELVKHNIIEKLEDNKYAFTKEYKKKHNL